MHDIRVLYMISQSSDMTDTANRIEKSYLVKRKQSTHNIVSSYLSRVEVQQKSEGDESERRELC
jgi:hypothetical protein